MVLAKLFWEIFAAESITMSSVSASPKWRRSGHPALWFAIGTVVLIAGSIGWMAATSRAAPDPKRSRMSPVPKNTAVIQNSRSIPRAKISAEALARQTKPPKPAPNPSPTASVIPAPFTSPYVVLGFNDLGMHCMNQDFSEMCILPPYNNLHAQVIDRTQDSPQIVNEHVTVSYSIPGNTFSAGKTNFWDFAKPLFGVALPKNVGLTGNKLSGTLLAQPDGDWAATGIPITPIMDDGTENPYALSLIKVTSGTKTLAATQAVVPVSWEISCNLCHNTPGVSVASSILLSHDKLHGTNLINQKPVLCATCHSDPALGTPGVAGVKSMSAAMHGSHATRFTPEILQTVGGQKNLCYSCHPGFRTHCQRDIHFAKGVTCIDCHGSMAAVGDIKRTPWVDEPKCSDCHTRKGFAFEEPGKLFKTSRGHNGVKCASCHGSPHAITPTVTNADNVQAIQTQGHAGTINDCKVCHKVRPDDPFNHTLGDG
jgi:hypothetical protein